MTTGEACDDNDATGSDSTRRQLQADEFRGNGVVTAGEGLRRRQQRRRRWRR